jgi:hypothetical protein
MGRAVWQRSVVRDIALNPAYIARRKVDGKLWPVDWPAIVTEAEHYAAVSVLKDPARTTTRPGRGVWLCSYIATCAKCEGTVAVGPRGTRPDGTVRKLYVCAKGCVAVQVAELDMAVKAKLCLYLADPEVYAALTRVDGTEAEAARGELARLEKELEDWQRAAGRVSIAAVEQAERNLAPQIADAKARLGVLSTASGALRKLMGDQQQTYAQLWMRWDEEVCMAQRREIVRELVTVVVAGKRRTRQAGVGVVGTPGPRIAIELR